MRFVQTTAALHRIELGLNDRKVLFALAQNCRSPLTLIAKKTGLGRDSVRYRINRMEKSGIIQGYRTIVDMSKFGYMSVHFLLQLNQPAEDAERRLVETFKAYQFCRAILKFNGKYDFELAVVAKNMGELDMISTRIITDCGKYLQHYDIQFITKFFTAKTFPENFLKHQEKRSEKQSDKKVSQKTILHVPDILDIRLLDILSDNADISLLRLAQELGTSADTVKYRMKKLFLAGIIKGFVPVINYEVIGYSVYAILLNIAGLTPQRESTLAEFLSTSKDVLWAVKLIGKYNLLLYICTTDSNDLTKTTTALRSYFTEAVKDYETLINYEEYKYTYWVMP